MSLYHSPPMILLILCMVLPAALASAQSAPPVTWEQTYSIGLESQPLDVIQTHDGGYAIAGTTLISEYSYNTTNYPPIPQDSDAFLIHTDADGKELWTRTYGDLTNDGAYSISKTLDGGFILAGYTSGAERLDADRYLVRTDPIGNVVWEKHYDTNPGFDALYTVCALPDGNFVVAGETDEGQNYGDHAGYLAEIDPDGEILWEKIYPGAYNEGYPGGVRSLDCTGDDGYLLSIYGTPALIRTDKQGNVIWSAYNDTVLTDARFAQDGGAIVTGFAPSPANRYPFLLLQKIDPTGRTEWIMPELHDWCWGRAVEVTADGGFLAIGTRAVFNEEPVEIKADTIYNLTILLVRTDMQGNVLWDATLSPGHFNEGMRVRESEDGGYIVLGTTADEAGLEYLLFLGNIPGKIYLAKLAGDEIPTETGTLQTPSMTTITTFSPVTSVAQGISDKEVETGATSASQEIPLVFAPLLAMLVAIGVIWYRKG